MYSLKVSKRGEDTLRLDLQEKYVQGRVEVEGMGSKWGDA